MPPKLNFVSDGHQTPYSIVSRVFRNAVRTNNAYNTIRKHVQNWVKVKTVELKPSNAFCTASVPTVLKTSSCVEFISRIPLKLNECFNFVLFIYSDLYESGKLNVRLSGSSSSTAK